MEFLRLKGPEARPYVADIARLRLTVFNEYPYLYEGTLEYEKNYLETYFKSQNSFVFLVRDQDRIVGASTCVLLDDEEASFKQPFLNAGIDPKKVCYFGESILLSSYRGKGLGKLFFKEREAFAQTLSGVELAAFCAVIRPDSHPLKPSTYAPLDEFWASQGFSKAANLVTQYEWKDIGENLPTHKVMQFWIKSLSKEELMNTESLIKSYYKAFNDKNFSGMLELLTDDIIHDTNQGSRSVGKEAFKSFLADMDRYYDEHLDQMVIMVSSDGQRASAEFICNGVYKSTCEGLPPAKNQTYKLPVGCFFDIRGGKIARVTNYYNMNDWLKQVK